jgi:hypothetical protein
MSIKTKPLVTNLLEFVERLEQHRIHYRLEHNRPESILVDIAVPGERWEVEFLENGEIEVERFVSDGHLCGDETLELLFHLHGSDEPSGQ